MKYLIYERINNSYNNHIYDDLNGIKLEKVKNECEQWTLSTSAEQMPKRKRLVNTSIINPISEVYDDEIILIDDPLVREIDHQILNTMEIQSQLEEDIEKLKIEFNNNSKKMNQLKEIKLSIVSKKIKMSPTTISYPFALVENRRHLKELLKKVIPDLKEVPNVQLEMTKEIFSLSVLPKLEKTLEKCQIPEKFAFDIISEILSDRNNFFRIIIEYEKWN